ncbi:hypothetical protein FA10DRAFT_35290 [Acaromyces ingoldii]|uniref:Uncharacterized protein n=1 Tax=Acaromyces ingoldii TaxID=215250 RepID=A0A316Z0R4_9BASI|nr:hypothetical protein FA10DRAFT_35290 [Acaromyces ingoldii]PWN93913.1 hypothetical protein FA10DRAFT_35290 [Acaromyces ingoldii]
MLNPSRYIEDAHLVPTRYVLLRVRFPLAKLARRLEGDGINIIANDARGNWQGLTGLAFDPFGADAQPLPSPQEAVSLEGTVVRCPNSACKAEQPLSWQQAAQPDWSIKCPSCSLLIRKETLLGKRFFDDMNVWRSRGSDTNGWRMRGGVLSKANGKPFHKDPYNPILYRLVQSNRKLSGTNEDARGKKIFDSTVDVIGKIEQGKATTPQAAFESERYDIEAISKSIYDRLSPGLDEAQRKQLHRRVSLMMSYYIDSHPLSPASLDLVAAVQRQFGFVDEMDSLGWLSGQLPSRELQEGLDNAIVRYHGWLNLSFRYPTAFISPTLDIDLAWHTHQLSPDYYTDCFRLLGRFLDHDDKVEKGRLGDAFQDTADLWRKLYDQPYSWCGCAEHRKKFATAKKLLSKLKGKSRARDDDDEDDAGEAAEEAPEGSIPTHPSAHNAVQVGEDSESVREKQDTTEEKSVKVMSASSSSGSGTRDGRQQHDNPFKRDYANMAPFLYIPAAHEAGGAVPGKCGLDTVGAGACLGGQASMINDRFARVMNIESNRLTMGSSGYPAYSGVGFVAMGGFGNCGGGGGGCGGGGGGCGGGGGGC